jgi:hypothetical protein
MAPKNGYAEFAGNTASAVDSSRQPGGCMPQPGIIWPNGCLVEFVAGLCDLHE